MNITVTGAGGFIGGHLVARLVEDGHDVTAVDIKPYAEWYQRHQCTNLRLDLRLSQHCREAICDAEQVFNLAADMGGMGFIETHKADCMMSVLITTHMLQAAREAGVSRFFQASSACVYPAGKQDRIDLEALAETDAWPADPEAGYGLEKLFGEELCRYFMDDYGLTTRVARFHNIYGPLGTWTGGREKAPAAICRKVAEAVQSGKHQIDIWGDGEQQRSFCWVDDCVEGTLRLTASDFGEPLNIGSAELVSINELVSIVEELAGIQLYRSYNLTAPQGVRGRNSENTLCRGTLDWEPSTPLRDGMATLYEWVADQVELAA